MQPTIRTANDLGLVIKAKRKQLDLGQADLADKIGVSRRWLNQIEQGKSGASIGLLLKALAALGLELAVIDPSDDQQKHVDIVPLFMTPDIDEVINDHRAGGEES